MKNILKIFPVTALLIFFATFVHAQKTDSIPHSHFYKNAVSLDMFYFLNIFRPNFLPGPTSQMAFDIERHLTPENIIRFGSAVIYNEYAVNIPSQPVLHNKNSSFLFLLGMEKEKEIASRWIFFYGIDVLYKNEFTRTNQGDTTIGITTDQSKAESYGISPVMGVKFELSPRIFISTETDFQLWINHTAVTSTNDMSSQSNRSNSTKSFFTEYAIPQNIYLVIEF